MSKKLSDLPEKTGLLGEDDKILITSQNESRFVKARTMLFSFLPAGIILSYGGNAIPEGWLPCDGRTVSRTDYPTLFAALGTTHGHGNGSTTFHLPDLRGRFIRGADDMGTGPANRDQDGDARTASNVGGAIGRGVGSFQGEQTKSHTHVQNAHTHGQNAHSHSTYQTQGTGGGATSAGGGLYGSANWNLHNGVTNSVTPGIHNNTATNQNTGGNETRPQNVNFNYIIKV